MCASAGARTACVHMRKSMNGTKPSIRKWTNTFLLSEGLFSQFMLEQVVVREGCSCI